MPVIRPVENIEDVQVMRFRCLPRPAMGPGKVESNGVACVVRIFSRGISGRDHSRSALTPCQQAY